MLYIGRICRVNECHVRFDLEWIEVGEIGYVFEPYDNNFNRFEIRNLRAGPGNFLQAQTVLIGKTYVVNIRQHPDYRFSCLFIYHVEPPLKYCRVPTEFVYDKPFNMPALPAQELDSTEKRSENASLFDITDEEHWGFRIFRSSHIDDIHIHKIYFSRA